MDSRTKFNLTMPSNNLRSPISSPKEPPLCVQNAMFKERKPFTYTPGGLDLSEIRSEKMAKRLMRNAMSPGVQERPKPPNFTPTDPSAPKSSHYFNLPIAVFPCVQIPSNPKELLRRTSGPFSRTESIDQSVESPKSESPIVNGHNKKDELSKCDKNKSRKIKTVNKTTYEETSRNKIKHENKIMRQESRTNKINNEEKSSVEEISKIKCEEVKSNSYKSEKIAINNMAYEEIKSKHIQSEDFINKNNVVYEDVKSKQISLDEIFMNNNNVTHEELKSKEISSDDIIMSKNIETYNDVESKQILSEKIITNTSNLAYEEFKSKEISSNDIIMNKNITAYEESETKQELSDEIFVNKNNEPRKEIKSRQISFSELFTNTNKVAYEEVKLKQISSEETSVNKIKCEENVNKIKIEEKSAVEIKNIIKNEAVVENNINDQNGLNIDFSEKMSNVNNVEISSSLREEQFNNIEEIIRIENNENEKIEQEICAEEEKMNESITDMSNINDEVSSQISDVNKDINEPSLEENVDVIDNNVDVYSEFETSDDADSKYIEDEGEKEHLEIEIEDRVVSPVKRNIEAIKGLSNDLDNLPSLNICTKRFSFLKESPDRDEEEDPFRIITGIPPKISLIDRVDSKKNCNDKIIEDSNKIINTDLKDTTGKGVDSFVSLLKEDLRSCSPYTKEDDWKKDCLTVKDILEDPEPAWKIEMREISLRKAEAKEESPLKDFAALTKKEFSTPIQSPYQNWDNFSQTSDKEKSPNSYLPTWSQTLRPKSWKDRNSDRPELSEWKKPIPDTYINKFARNQTEVRKTPEITVEVVNQPYGTTTRSTSNGYVYPWESSPESSVAFSPEPRTPTPQSRNSPFSLSVNSPSAYGNAHPAVISREYGTLGYQPSRSRSNINRSCPIQSRSFKYLQLLTGTYENYENDNEPYIPQPAQHAYPRPGNF